MSGVKASTSSFFIFLFSMKTRASESKPALASKDNDMGLSSAYQAAASIHDAAAVRIGTAILDDVRMFVYVQIYRSTEANIVSK